MTKLIRLAAGVLCLGALALGVVAFDPACLPTLPHRWDPDKTASLAEEFARQEELDQREDAIRHRRQTKEHVAAEVIARRRSLAEAVEQFRILNQQWPPIPRPERIILGRLGMSEEEWDAREVLRFVELVLADRPEEAAAVIGRLEKELQQLLADWKKHRSTSVDPRTEERCR
jgi:hypothetical protein